MAEFVTEIMLNVISTIPNFVLFQFIEQFNGIKEKMKSSPQDKKGSGAGDSSVTANGTARASVVSAAEQPVVKHTKVSDAIRDLVVLEELVYVQCYEKMNCLGSKLSCRLAQFLFGGTLKCRPEEFQHCCCAR